MKDRNSIATELLMFLSGLAQMESKDKIITAFITALKNNFPNLNPQYRAEIVESDANHFEISSSGKKHGYLMFESQLTEKETNYLPAICSLLAVTLTNVEQKLLLTENQVCLDKLEKQFEANQVKLNSLIDSAPFAVIMSSGIDQETDYLNPAFIDLFGYTIDDIPSIKEWWKLAYPDVNLRLRIKKEWEQMVKTAIHTQSTTEALETVVTCKNGSEKNISWIFISTEQQNWSFGVDVTDRKMIETELIKQKDLFELVLNSAPISIFWKDLNSVYQGCNNHFAKEANMKNPEAVVGSTDEIMIWGYKAEKFRRDDRYVMSSSMPKLNYEEDFIDENGDIVWWETNKTPLRSRDGEVIGVLATAKNITSQKMAQIALQNSEEKFRNLYENSPFGIVICKLLKDNKSKFIDFIHLEANLATKINTGFELEQLVGIKASQMVDSKALTELVDLYSSVVTTGNSINFEQYFEIYQRTLEVTAFPLHEDYFILNFIDISERKSAEDQLKQRIEDLQTFNETAVDREIVINNQRKEINELLVKAGKKPKYDIVE